MTERAIILAALILWAFIYLPVGFFVSFTVGANDTVWTVVALLLLFGAPFPVSLGAFKFPRVAAYLLIFCGIFSIVTFFAQIPAQIPKVEALKGLALHPYFAPHFLFAGLLLSPRVRRTNHESEPVNG